MTVNWERSSFGTLHAKLGDIARIHVHTSGDGDGGYWWEFTTPGVCSHEGPAATEAEAQEKAVQTAQRLLFAALDATGLTDVEHVAMSRRAERAAVWREVLDIQARAVAKAATEPAVVQACLFAHDVLEAADAGKTL